MGFLVFQKSSSTTEWLINNNENITYNIIPRGQDADTILKSSLKLFKNYRSNKNQKWV